MASFCSTSRTETPRRAISASSSPTCSTSLGAGVLSGGEQQMLTMCRTLMGDPDLMLIDEPTEGLAPKLVEQVGELLAEIARRGVSVLLVEQKLAIALRISSRLYVMGHGRIVFEGTPDDLGANSAVRKEWLEV
jgi:branched-chain amino acid transport system ATP-binding protein